MAKVDEDGYFHFVERRKDIIKYKGWTVLPSEIEKVIHTHHMVKIVAVLGLPKPDVGEEVVAVIVPKEEYRGKITKKEIINSCREKMASHMIPTKVLFRASLPLTITGKVFKRQLREELSQAPVSPICLAKQ